MDTPTFAEAYAEFQRLSAAMLRANENAKRWGLVEARRERNYRRTSSMEWAKAKLQLDMKTASEITNYVEGITSEAREKRDVARVMGKAMSDLERDHRQQMSAMQSLMNMAREELAATRVGHADPPPAPRNFEE